MAISPKTYAVNPKEWRLFRTWITIVPSTDISNDNPNRLVTYRHTGKVAAFIYNALRANAFIKLPDYPTDIISPSGSSLKGVKPYIGYTPRIGNKLPYIFLSGHFHSSREISDPYSTRPVFSGGVLYDIPTNRDMGVRAPNPNVVDDLKDLKLIISNSLDQLVDQQLGYNIDKIDYLGLIFGLGGLQFPR